MNHMCFYHIWITCEMLFQFHMWVFSCGFFRMSSWHYFMQEDVKIYVIKKSYCWYLGSIVWAITLRHCYFKWLPKVGHETLCKGTFSQITAHSKNVSTIKKGTLSLRKRHLPWDFKTWVGAWPSCPPPRLRLATQPRHSTYPIDARTSRCVKWCHKKIHLLK